MLKICEVEKMTTFSDCFKKNKEDMELISLTYVKVIRVTFSNLNRPSYHTEEVFQHETILYLDLKLIVLSRRSEEPTITDLISSHNGFVR